MKNLYLSALAVMCLCLTPLLSSAQYAPLPYSTGFENGLDANWVTQSTPSTGRIQIWGQIPWLQNDTAFPHTGSQMLGMDVAQANGGTYHTNESWMRLDLSGATNVVLDFWWQEWNDESEPEDGVYFSDNGGTNFVKVLDLPGAQYTDLTWYNFTLNVDSLCQANNLSLSATFVVKFQQRDNYYFAGGNDGHLYDDISVTGVTCSNPPVIACQPDVSIAADSANCNTIWQWQTPMATSQCGGSPLKITEVGPNSPDFIEIQNTGPAADYSGYFVAVSDDYNTISITNTLVWDLGPMTANQIMYREDATGSFYWGNNLFWNSSASSWAMIIDSANATVVDAVFWGWDSTSIANFSTTINGVAVTIPPSVWSGDGVPTNCANSYTRTGTTDNNDASDWVCASITKGTPNANYSPQPGGIAAGVAVNQVAGPANGSPLPLGVTTITYVATDSGNGLSDTCSFTITVIDSTAPVANCQNVTAQLNASGMVTVSAAAVGGQSTDNCGVDILSLSDTLFTCMDLGQNQVTLTVFDASQNSSTCTAVVDVVDSTGAAAVPINLGPDQAICDGSSSILDAGPGFVSYLWSTGATTQTITVNTAGTYSVTVTNQMGCSGDDDIVLTFGSVTPSVTVNGDTLCANAATSYQWFLNGNAIPGATSQCIEASQGGGTYYVQTVDTFGCILDSDTILVVGTMGPAPSLLHTEVWPNPFREETNISFSLPVAAEVKVEIFSLTGKQVAVLFEGAVAPNENKVLTFRPENTTSGVYLYRISTDQGFQNTGRLMLNR